MIEKNLCEQICIGTFLLKRNVNKKLSYCRESVHRQSLQHSRTFKVSPISLPIGSLSATSYYNTNLHPIT